MTIDKIGPADFDQTLGHPQTDHRFEPKTRSKEIPPKRVEVETADLEKVKAILAESDISLNFHRDESTGRIVVEMIDNATGDAVRQIPNEVSLRLSELFNKIQGNIFEARV
jgi:flagellar protein FlaG